MPPDASPDSRPVDDRELPTLESLDAVVEVVESRPNLYRRYSRGPDSDAGSVSRDYEAAVDLPGLSASTIAPEPWWPRPAKDWVARRICEYDELGEADGRFPWLLRGRLIGYGPDHEPLVTIEAPIARLAPQAPHEARAWYERRFDVGRDSTRADGSAGSGDVTAGGPADPGRD